MLRSTLASIEREFASDPDWLDNHISKLLPSNETRHELILFVLGDGGNAQRAKWLLENQVWGLNQPVIPASALFARNRSPFDSIREAVVRYVGARYFSPYRIDQVAVQKMFVGR